MTRGRFSVRLRHALFGRRSVYDTGRDLQVPALPERSMTPLFLEPGAYGAGEAQSWQQRQPRRGTT